MKFNASVLRHGTTLSRRAALGAMGAGVAFGANFPRRVRAAGSDTLVVSSGGEAVTLDPQVSFDGTSPLLWRACYETLLRLDGSSLDVVPHLAESYEVAPGIRLGAMYANHPGTTLALSLELDGKKFVYAADGEAAGESAGAMQDYDEKLAKFARGADLLVHDAQFTEQDHRPHSGHSHVGAALAVAEAAGARELWLFHLNPEYGEDKLREVESEAAARAEKAGFRCRLAREGLRQDF